MFSIFSSESYCFPLWKSMPARLRKGLILIPLVPHTANQTEVSWSDPPPFPCRAVTHTWTQWVGDPKTRAGQQERTPHTGTAWARAARGAGPGHPGPSSNAEQHSAYNFTHRTATRLQKKLGKKWNCPLMLQKNSFPQKGHGKKKLSCKHQQKLSVITRANRVTGSQ